jgi:hypothetical protein
VFDDDPAACETEYRARALSHQSKRLALVARQQQAKPKHRQQQRKDRGDTHGKQP